MVQENLHGGARKGAGRKRAVKVQTLTAIVACGHCGHSAHLTAIANGQDVLCRRCGKVGVMPAKATVARLEAGDKREIEL